MSLRRKKKKAWVVPADEPAVVEDVPHIPFRVVEVDIPFYTDAECSEVVEDARLVIIQALDPDDQILELELVPTTKNYQKGDYVTMNLDSKRLWDTCWYRDPGTGKIEKAWNVHVNFIGDRISAAALEKERERIHDLERRLDERMRASPPNEKTVN